MTSDGAQARLTLLVQDDQIHNQIATILAENWASIGIEVVLDVRPYAELMTSLESRVYEAALVDIDLSNSPIRTHIPSGRNLKLTMGRIIRNGVIPLPVSTSNKPERNRIETYEYAFTATFRFSLLKICLPCHCSTPFTIMG